MSAIITEHLTTFSIEDPAFARIVLMFSSV